MPDVVTRAAFAALAERVAALEASAARRAAIADRASDLSASAQAALDRANELESRDAARSEAVRALVAAGRARADEMRGRLRPVDPGPPDTGEAVDPTRPTTPNARSTP